MILRWGLRPPVSGYYIGSDPAQYIQQRPFGGAGEVPPPSGSGQEMVFAGHAAGCGGFRHVVRIGK